MGPWAGKFLQPVATHHGMSLPGAVTGRWGASALNLALLQSLVAGTYFSSFCKHSEDSAFELFPMATALGDN